LEKMLDIPSLIFLALGVTLVTLGAIIILEAVGKRKLIFRRIL